MYMFDRYRTNASVKRIVHAGNWNVFWGSPRGTWGVDSTSENNLSIYDIFHDIYWYSVTIYVTWIHETNQFYREICCLYDKCRLEAVLHFYNSRRITAVSSKVFGANWLGVCIRRMFVISFPARKWCWAGFYVWQTGHATVDRPFFSHTTIFFMSPKRDIQDSRVPRSRFWHRHTCEVNSSWDIASGIFARSLCGAILGGSHLKIYSV